MTESEEELKSHLMKVKVESEKVGLKLNIQKMKIMASGPITSWQIDGETVETVSDFILGGSKIIADGDCSHEIQRCSLLGRKVMSNLDSILKSRDITLPTKVHLVKAVVFPVVMYGCKSWITKKAECQIIDTFELWCWKRLLRVPWTARRSNQSILKEISPGYSLEGLMLKLKLQYFGHLMRRADLLEKILLLGDWGQEEKGMTEDEMVGWHNRLNGHEFGWTPGVGDGQGGLAFCSPWGRKELDMTERLNWTELNWWQKGKNIQWRQPLQKIILEKLICCCLIMNRACLFCGPMDCSPPDSSIHEISKARILEQVAISFSRGSSQPRDQTRIFYTDRQIPEPPEKPRKNE